MSKPTLPTLSDSGAIEALAQRFGEVASAGDILKLVDLWRDAKRAEAEAELRKEAVARRQEMAARTLELRAAVVDTLGKQRLDRTDRAVDALVDKLRDAEDPTVIAALAQALGAVAATDQLGDLAEVVQNVRAGDDDLTF